ncbi:TPA: methyltransferase [Candidatus Peribacteria bacterium]|nr:methyltransferase [Candidatus Peribacteria bacterium]HAS34581.1 methyltransferase [Candidatus Peribacteria bacterium]
MFTEIRKCRICGNAQLTSLLDLHEQALTGVFPSSPDQKVETAPVELVKCTGAGACGLVQLRHSAAPSEMYGMNYGYRSGLNQSMVRHLQGIADQALALAHPSEGDLIVDIGSNDATLLKCYDAANYRLVGIDPTGIKFKKYYPKNVRLIADFFSEGLFRREFQDIRPKIITSIAMLYDLENPQAFIDDVGRVLSDDGIWIFEQSYLPSMLKATAYDTICHEHLEYYSLTQVLPMLKRAGMRAVDVALNDANGGSFRVVAVKGANPAQPAPSVAQQWEREREEHLGDLAVYARFRERVERHRDDLQALLKRIKEEGKVVFGLGASTKGNVLLQYCGITVEDLPFIAEVNEDKFGKFTPRTGIPILPQAEADARKPDYYLVLPWHFRAGITKGMAAFLKGGGKLIFPLPELSVVGEEVL